MSLDIPKVSLILGFSGNYFLFSFFLVFCALKLSHSMSYLALTDLGMINLS